MAEVVLAEHTDHAVQLVPVFQTSHMLVAVEVCLYLFIESQHLRHLGKILVYIFADQLTLLSDDIL